MNKHPTQIIYIFWTCKDAPEAKKIIYDLLEKQFIACASILPEIESIYRWKGIIEESKEVKVILKTAKHHFASIQSYIQMHSSYDLPEILQVDIAQASKAFVSWIEKETTILTSII